MDSVDFVFHLLNLFAPALGLALLLPTLARLFWRSALRGVSWSHQVKWLLMANAAVLVLGLALLGRDGATLTYAGLVLSSALGVWWTGLKDR
jgi:hypothetical protein